MFFIYMNHEKEDIHIDMLAIFRNLKWSSIRMHLSLQFLEVCFNYQMVLSHNLQLFIFEFCFQIVDLKCWVVVILWLFHPRFLHN